MSTNSDGTAGANAVGSVSADSVWSDSAEEGFCSAAELKYRPFSQCFKPEEETAYQQLQWGMLGRYFRFALWGGAVFYLLLSGFDYFLFEQQVPWAGAIRLLVAFFTVQSVLLANRWVNTLPGHEWVQTGFCILVMLTVELASLVAPVAMRPLYVMGLLLSWMFSFILMRVPLRYALWLMVTGVALHDLTSVCLGHYPLGVLTTENLALLAAGIMLGCGSYFLEKGSRDLYCQLRQIRMHNRSLEVVNERLSVQSRHDALTGLHNRRSFEERYELECRRAARAASMVGVMVIDVDAFKQFNDSCGHVAGDRCLKLVANAIGTAARRPGDIVARFGGEEFVVVWPGTGAQDVYQEALRLCARVEALNIYHPRGAVGQKVTVSVGVACGVPEQEQGSRRLFEAADAALYRAKRQGRNQVELWTDTVLYPDLGKVAS